MSSLSTSLMHKSDSTFGDATTTVFLSRHPAEFHPEEDMDIELREVVVSYAGGRQGPWKKEYADTTPMATVRSDAMDHFGVADSADGGNQVAFRLYRGGDRIDDLNLTVSQVGHGQGALALRLVREVIAG